MLDTGVSLHGASDLQGAAFMYAGGVAGVRLDRGAPEREPALELRLDRQFVGDLRLQLQLALGGPLLRAPARRHERVPVAALVVVDEVDPLPVAVRAGARVVVEGEHRAQQPLAVARGLDRSGD